MKINLKLINEKDLELLRKWRNDYANDFFSAEIITKEMQKKWYDAYKEDQQDMMWIIYCNNAPCGTVALLHISIPNRTAELGRILLLEEYRGKGIMEEAIFKVLEIADKKLRLYKIRVYAYLDNLSGFSLYEKVGFAGTKRPIILLERINIDFNSKQPMTVESYDEIGDSGYESQCSNIQ